MAEYPKQYINKLDQAVTSEALPLIGLFLLDMAVTFAGLYIVGAIVNGLF